jgi:hypothetical protein
MLLSVGRDRISFLTVRVTVTFPDKAQVTFHVACLDQYRAVLWPRAAP